MLNPTFKSNMKKVFSLETFPIAATSDRSQVIGDMEQWANRVTQGLIPSIAPEPPMEASFTLLNTLDLFGNPQKGLPIFPKNEILGNMSKISYGFRTSLLYFKAHWSYKFQFRPPGKTSSFTLINGETITVPVMSDEYGFPFMQNEELRALEMPYFSFGSYSIPG